ncbi:MAG: TonB-dependent receptor [Gemmatimonadota bacterium]
MVRWRAAVLRPPGIGAALLTFGGLLLVHSAAGGQERQPPRDTLRADTLEIGPRQAPRKRRVQAFPKRLVEGQGRAYPVQECDRECLISAPVLSLVELLERMAPGLTVFRAEYFGGPHHLLSGPSGAGFVRVVLDGRELLPLESGQVDLTRISLVQLDRVRVVRRSGDVVVDLTSRRQDEPVAYSRITGGTGAPDAQVLRGTFSNGLGRDLVMEGFFDLLDVNDGGRENDLFEFQGRVGWMPGNNRFGVELEYSNQDVLRTSADSVEFDRRELFLRGRANLTRHVQTELRLGSSQWREEGEALRDVDEAALVVAAASGRTSALAEVRLLDGAAYPSLTGRVEGSFQPLPQVSFDAGFEAASWDDFGTSEARFGASLNDPLHLPLTLRVDAGTGTRGISRPQELAAMEEGVSPADPTSPPDSASPVEFLPADSVSFDAVAFRAETQVGAYRLLGRYSFQRLSRLLPFGDRFDRLLPPGAEAKVNGLEAGLSGPILPLGALVEGLEPIRLEGYWRHQDPETEGVLYLPDQLLYGRLTWHGKLFDENLEFWLSGDFSRRAEMLAARPGEPEPVLLPARKWAGGHLSFRVAGFRFWWRLGAPSGSDEGDVSGILFPNRVNVVGIKWEFLN